MILRNNRLTSFKNLFINIIDKNASLLFYQEELNRNSNDIEKIKVELEIIKNELQNISISIRDLTNHIAILKDEKSKIIAKDYKTEFKTELEVDLENTINDEVNNLNRIVLELINLINIENINIELLRFYYNNYKRFESITNFIEYIESNKNELNAFFEVADSDLLGSIIYSSVYKEPDANPVVNSISNPDKHSVSNISLNKALKGVEKTNAIQAVSKEIRELIKEVIAERQLQKQFNEKAKNFYQKRLNLEKTKKELEGFLNSEKSILDNLKENFEITPLRLYKTKTITLNNCNIHTINILKINQIGGNQTDKANLSDEEFRKFYGVFVDFYKENDDFLFTHKGIKYAISATSEFRIYEQKDSQGNKIYSRKVGDKSVNINTFYNTDKRTINHLVSLIEDKDLKINNN